jgi:F0F1-type ATP synthase gamma subunit
MPRSPQATYKGGRDRGSSKPTAKYAQHTRHTPRIKSVKNTAQITKAMQMVAASKMRKAQQAALAGRPTPPDEPGAGRVTPSRGDFTHPLMEKREVRKRA